MSGAGYAMIGTIVTLVVVSSFFRAGMLTAAPGQPVPIGNTTKRTIHAAHALLVGPTLLSCGVSSSVLFVGGVASERRSDSHFLFHVALSADTLSGAIARRSCGHHMPTKLLLRLCASARARGGW